MSPVVFRDRVSWVSLGHEYRGYVIHVDSDRVVVRSDTGCEWTFERTDAERRLTRVERQATKTT